MGLYFSTRARWDLWQREDEVEIIVRGDSVEAFDATTETAMDEHILSVGPLEAANWFHSAFAGTHAISYTPVIDVAGVKAEWAMVSMMSSAFWRTDKTTTMLTLEYLF